MEPAFRIRIRGKYYNSLIKEIARARGAFRDDTGQEAVSMQVVAEPVYVYGQHCWEAVVSVSIGRSEK